MDAVQLRIFILYTIMNKKKKKAPKVCSKKNVKIVILGFVATLMRIPHINYVRIIMYTYTHRAARRLSPAQSLSRGAPRLYIYRINTRFRVYNERCTRNS